MIRFFTLAFFILGLACSKGESSAEPQVTQVTEEQAATLLAPNNQDEPKKFHDECVKFCHHVLSCAEAEVSSTGGENLPRETFVSQLKECTNECQSGTFQFKGLNAESVVMNLDDRVMANILDCLMGQDCPRLLDNGGYECLRFARTDRNECSFCQSLINCPPTLDPLTNQQMNLEREDCLDACIEYFDDTQWQCLSRHSFPGNQCEYFQARMVSCR